jgi:1-aminocyclopropane-1-carboxylate deaminase/D-cysteine desulfhydrase-like pyridoxal-dependent ACC family enzyme
MLAYATEGLLFDPAYTCIGLSGLIDWVGHSRLTKIDAVIFLYIGGSAALFGYHQAFALKGYVKWRAFLSWLAARLEAFE